jgi:hypothetical protein
MVGKLAVGKLALGRLELGRDPGIQGGQVQQSTNL